MAFAFQRLCRHFAGLNGLTEGPCYLHPMNEAMLSRRSFSGALGSISYFLLLALGLTGCQSPHPHQTELDALHQLEDSVSAAFAQLEALPSDSVQASANWASANLQELELLLSGGHIEITKAEGSIISEVSRARRLLKDHESRRNRLTQNTERTHLQLQLLTEAIAQNARVDGAGTPIDSTYIAEQVQTEVRIARELIAALDETTDLARRGMNVVEGARLDNDSLQTILRARLAQYILNGIDASTPEDS
jgi:hypothetical protein